MNKHECKKYIRRAYLKILEQSGEMTPKNIAIQMEKEIKDESKIYIAYAKLSMHMLNRSASNINIKQLTSEIDVISKIYSKFDVIKKAENI